MLGSLCILFKKNNINVKSNMFTWGGWIKYLVQQNILHLIINASVCIYVPINIDNIGCSEPFLPLYDHFEIRRFLGLKCKVDLTPCRTKTSDPQCQAVCIYVPIGWVNRIIFFSQNILHLIFNVRQYAFMYPSDEWTWMRFSTDAWCRHLNAKVVIVHCKRRGWRW